MLCRSLWGLETVRFRGQNLDLSRHKNKIIIIDGVNCGIFLGHGHSHCHAGFHFLLIASANRIEYIWWATRAELVI